MNNLSENQLFQKNLERWSRFCPEAAQQIKQLPDKSKNVHIVEQEGKVNLQIFQDGIGYSCHGTNPEEESAAWIKQIDLRDCELLYFYGVGLGYSFDALEKWLSDPTHCLVFIEDNLEVIKALLQTERASRLLEHPRVWLYYLDRTPGHFESYIEMFALKKYKLTALPIYHQLFFSTLQELHIAISFARNIQFANRIEFKDHGIGFLPNFYFNLQYWPSAYLGDGLFGKFQGVPAIICGAGPSLIKNVDLLRELSDRALIFAGGTAMNAINAHGVTPHLGLGIDPNFEQSTRVIMQSAFNVPFLFRSRMNHTALGMVSGDRLYVSGSSGYDIADYFDGRLNIPTSGFDEGCNVINFGLSAAAMMGCNPIILVGVDLAYSESQSYAKGVTHHPVHFQKNLFRTKEQSEELVQHHDIYGKPIVTLWKWIAESVWFSKFAISHPEIPIINATEGGIGFSGIMNKSLQDVANDYLTRSQDLQIRLFGEIQKHPMPIDSDGQCIVDLLKDLQISLNKLLNELNDCQAAIDIHASSGSELNDQQKEEIGYRYLLRRFSEAFDAMTAIEAFRLKTDVDLYSASIQRDKEEILQRRRIAYLQKAAATSINFITHVLEKMAGIHNVQQKQVQVVSAMPKLDDNCRYSYENGVLTIIDPNIGIEFVQKFIPEKPEDTFRVFDDKGKLLYECFYHNGKLHGPSSSFGNDGQILARSWFIDGLRQGITSLYFPNGALAGINRYCDGLPDGIQERYWPNGQLRTHLSYLKGVLEGEVTLFNQSGMKMRELSFAAGKRHGTERIWNELGHLIIEANFCDDKPSETAKVWEDNGVLTQETSYDNEGKIVQVMRWDTHGNPIDSEDWQKADYFEDVAKKTGVITKNLGQVCEKMAGIVPMLSTSNSFSEDLEKLEKEFANLQNLQAQMLSESGLDDSNLIEEIWKSPSVKREVQLKVDAISQNLNENLAKLQEAIKKLNQTSSD